MQLSRGQILHDRYRIVRLIREDAAGVIYRAWDVEMNTPCAVQENPVTPFSAHQGFSRYANQLSQLSHPNLPRVIDHFILPDQGQYLVVEYADGEDLESMVSRCGGPLAETQVLNWLTQVCQALIYLHSQVPPIIHRDIRPANIQVTPQGRVRLITYGVPRFHHTAPGAEPGPPLAVPGYSPPEQYGQGITDARSEVYALGATTYFLVTGRQAVESVQRTVGAYLPDPRTLNPAVSHRVESVILQALALQPRQRFASVDRFRDALLSRAPLPTGQADIASPSGSHAPAEGRVRPGPVRAPLPATGVAAAQPGGRVTRKGLFTRIVTRLLLFLAVVAVLACLAVMIILMAYPELIEDFLAADGEPTTALLVQGTVSHQMAGEAPAIRLPGDAIPFGAGSIITVDQDAARLDLPGDYRVVLAGEPEQPTRVEFFQAGTPGETSQTILHLQVGSLFIVSGGAGDETILVTVMSLIGQASVSSTVMGARYNDATRVFEVDCVIGVCDLETDKSARLRLIEGQRGWVDASGVANGPLTMQLELYRHYPLADFIPAALLVSLTPTTTETLSPTTLLTPTVTLNLTPDSSILPDPVNTALPDSY